MYVTFAILILNCILSLATQRGVIFKCVLQHGAVVHWGKIDALESAQRVLTSTVRLKSNGGRYKNVMGEAGERQEGDRKKSGVEMEGWGTKWHRGIRKNG